MPQVSVKRSQLKPGEILCSYCTARCCRYFALPVDTPTKWKDFDHMRWFMMHGNVSVFVEDDAWYLMVFADCKHLQEDHRCGNYEDRPQICRDYTTEDCEYDNDGCYEMLFETPEQVWEYAETILPPRRKSKRPVELPVLTG